MEWTFCQRYQRAPFTRLNYSNGVISKECLASNVSGYLANSSCMVSTGKNASKRKRKPRLSTKIPRTTTADGVAVPLHSSVYRFLINQAGLTLSDVRGWSRLLTSSPQNISTFNSPSNLPTRALLKSSESKRSHMSVNLFTVPLNVGLLAHSTIGSIACTPDRKGVPFWRPIWISNSVRLYNVGIGPIGVSRSMTLRRLLVSCCGAWEGSRILGRRLRWV